VSAIQSLANTRAAELAAAVRESADRIKGRVIRTPLVRLPWLDNSKRKAWAKLECWQRTGAFKIRGAYNALLQLEGASSIIAASAGNHGLSLAVAANEIGIRCRICVPVNASELKVRRLIHAGAQVTPVGRDLFAATKYALSEASRGGDCYISGYADPNVVAGQGTCAVEAEQDAGEFDAVLVPLGGGGLLAGIGSYLRWAAPRTRVIAVYPKILGRTLERGKLGEQLTRPVVPTIADGLAVQLEEDSWVVPILEDVTNEFIGLTEHEIEVGIYALLHNEGLLVEGAGAVGVAALLRDLDGEQITGNVLIIVSGGNISSTQVAQVMSVPVSDGRIRTLLGLRAIRTPLEVATGHRGEVIQPSLSSLSSPLPESRHSTEDTTAIWEGMVSTARKEIDELESQIQLHEKYIVTLGLRSDPFIFQAVEEQLRVARSLANSCGAAWSRAAWQLRGRYRLLLQQIALLKDMLQWCSPSYDQSLEVMFFDPTEQRNPGVNYARYGSVALRNFELWLTGVLGFEPEQLALLATSSGQAAYQLIETFLLRDVLKPGDRVLYAPYIYFEVAEQMRSIPYLCHVKCSSYAVDDIVAAAEECDAKVLFLDPLANVVGMPTIDLRGLAAGLTHRHWSNRWLVIDGTMVSGGVNPFEWFSAHNHPRILYYESASKYLQIGLDLQMGGFCVANPDLMARLFRYRRNSGTILYPMGVSRWPKYDRGQFLHHMRAVSSNAHRLACAIAIAGIDSPHRLQVGFPHHWQELGWKHGGGVLTVLFGNPGLNNRARLEALIELLLQECRATGVPITKGVSFGFNVTRMSASAAMAEESDPFLRFSAGQESPEEVERLCIALIRGLRSFLDQEGVS